MNCFIILIRWLQCLMSHGEHRPPIKMNGGQCPPYSLFVVVVVVIVTVAEQIFARPQRCWIAVAFARLSHRLSGVEDLLNQRRADSLIPDPQVPVQVPIKISTTVDPRLLAAGHRRQRRGRPQHDVGMFAGFDGADVAVDS